MSTFYRLEITATEESDAVLEMSPSWVSSFLRTTLFSFLCRTGSRVFWFGPTSLEIYWCEWEGSLHLFVHIQEAYTSLSKWLLDIVFDFQALQISENKKSKSPLRCRKVICSGLWI